MSESNPGASPKLPCFYYDDPLKAAWMAKHFGMQFWNTEHEIHVLPLVDAEKTAYRLVHPDSYSLFEPQELDILHRTNGYCQTVGVHIGIPKTVAQIAVGGVIIQREGKAFFWPEQEAA